jgi:hypothetical protein
VVLAAVEERKRRHRRHAARDKQRDHNCHGRTTHAPDNNPANRAITKTRAGRSCPPSQFRARRIEFEQTCFSRRRFRIFRPLRNPSFKSKRSLSHEIGTRDLLRRGNGGGRGIRTPGTLAGTTVFKTAGINRSPIPPLGMELYLFTPTCAYIASASLAVSLPTLQKSGSDFNATNPSVEQLGGEQSGLDVNTAWLNRPSYLPSRRLLVEQALQLVSHGAAHPPAKFAFWTDPATTTIGTGVNG